MLGTPLGWVVIGAAALIGIVIGAVATHLLTARRHEAAVKQAADAARRDGAATMERLRAAYTSVRLEQEHQRAALPRKLAAAALEQRATIARLEDELRVAQVELDRLRPRGFGADVSRRDRRETDHGFAPTQTFDNPD